MYFSCKCSCVVVVSIEQRIHRTTSIFIRPFYLFVFTRSDRQFAPVSHCPTIRTLARVLMF